MIWGGKPHYFRKHSYIHATHTSPDPSRPTRTLSHRLHQQSYYLTKIVQGSYPIPIWVHGIYYLYTHIYHNKSTIHVGKYTSPMDPIWDIGCCFYTVSWEKNHSNLSWRYVMHIKMCFNSWSRNKWSYIQILWWIKSVLVEYNLNSSIQILCPGMMLYYPEVWYHATQFIQPKVPPEKCRIVDFKTIDVKV